ncbi:MAG: DNA-binding protein AraC-type, partial [Bacillota bacterium]|nr:DNA-binding protein AraC-type [Bacillota bacterium]
MEEAIKTLQKKIEARHHANILHVLNGFHMLKRFKDNNLIKENQTYVPFNE